jgi:hypothetical protein
MRTFIILILSCASVLGADTSIHVVTTCKTNESGTVSTKDVFTRDGQTNLVCNTYTKLGVVRIRIHRFYYHGSLVGDFVVTPDSSGFTTGAGSPCSVSFGFDTFHNAKWAVIGTKDGVIVDAFSCINGIFSPVESSLITKANSVGADVRGVMDELSKARKDR